MQCIWFKTCLSVFFAVPLITQFTPVSITQPIFCGKLNCSWWISSPSLWGALEQNRTKFWKLWTYLKAGKSFKVGFWTFYQYFVISQFTQMMMIMQVWWWQWGEWRWWLWWWRGGGREECSAVDKSVKSNNDRRHKLSPPQWRWAGGGGGAWFWW